MEDKKQSIREEIRELRVKKSFSESQNKIDELKKSSRELQEQKAALGVFKLKEKSAIQAQIVENDIAISGMTKELNKKRETLQAEIDELEKELETINSKLK